MHHCGIAWVVGEVGRFERIFVIIKEFDIQLSILFIQIHSETINVANDLNYESIMNEMRDLLKTGWKNCLPDVGSYSGEIPSFR